MRSLILALAVVASIPAAAQNRIDARQLDCRTVQSLIWERGAAVLTTGRHTYDRYVADGRFCAWPNAARPEVIPTADTNQCPSIAADRRSSTAGIEQPQLPTAARAALGE